MNLFAHNGVDHQSATEAANHSASSTVLIVLLISAAVIALVTISVFLLKKFSFVKETAQEEKRK